MSAIAPAGPKTRPAPPWPRHLGCDGTARVRPRVGLRRTASSCCRPVQAVEGGLEEGSQVVGRFVDLGDGDDQVEDLLQRQVIADLSRLLGRGQQRTTRLDGPGAVAGDALPAGVLQQLRDDQPFVRDERDLQAQPGSEGRRRALARLDRGGAADLVDLVPCSTSSPGYVTSSPRSAALPPRAPGRADTPGAQRPHLHCCARPRVPPPRERDGGTVSALGPRA